MNEIIEAVLTTGRGWVWLAGVSTMLMVWLLLPRRRALQGIVPTDEGSLPTGWPARLAAGMRVGIGPHGTPTQRLLVAVAAGSVMVLAIPGWPGVAVAVVAGLAGAALVGWLPPGGQRRRRQRLDQELPTAVELLAAVLAAGSPLRVAVAQVAVVSPETTRQVLESVVAHQAVGRSEADAWAQLSQQPDWAGGWVVVGRDLASAASTGSAVVSVLELHAREGRRRRQEELEKRARVVGVRSVMPLMLCFLPAFIAVAVVPIIAGLLVDLF